ncbi:MAG TPA: DUF2845 domain-containing protein [Steroidobacteraceae bacterium]|nr:DUF2845 domain-containing protein [Steroidobacteraceae bacterium]
MNSPLARISLLTLGLAFSSHALASGTLRCNESIISEGDTTAEVLHKCGKPITIAESVVKEKQAVKVRGQVDVKQELTVETVVEYWTYNFGPNRLMSRLTVAQGSVINIATLGYGF